MAYRILMIGGGSGGHAMPLLAVGEALQKTAQAQSRPIELYFLGEKRWLEAGTKARGWQLRSLVAGKLRGYFSPLIFLDYLKIFSGFWQALWRGFLIMSAAGFFKGGFVSLFPAPRAKIF